MNRLKPLIALIVLALWATCTARCELVCMTGSAEVACCIDAAGQSPEAPAPADDCVCSWIKTGGYIAERNFVSLQLPVALLPLEFPSRPQVDLSALATTILTASPPDLPPSWQFFHRTALSPRAPSVIS